VITNNRKHSSIINNKFS